MSGRLFDHECCSCGSVMSVNYPLLYHDMDLPSAIWLIPEGDNLRNYDSALKQFARVLPGNHYKLRIVRTRDELVETIRVFDSGLDDVVVQLLKFTYISNNVDAPKGPWFFSETTVSNQKDYMEFIAPTTGRTASIQIDDGYFKMVRHLGESEPLGEWFYADARFAIKLLHESDPDKRRSYQTFEEWYSVFKRAAGGANPLLTVDKNDHNLVDFMEHEPLQRAFRDGKDPEALGIEFAAGFDVSTFGRRR